MDFALSPKAEDAVGRMWDFMREEVLPAEPVWARHLAEYGPHATPAVLEDLKDSARKRGLSFTGGTTCRSRTFRPWRIRSSDIAF